MLPDPGSPGRAVSRGGTSPERRYAAARAPGESRTRRGRPARARPRRRGSPDPIPNSAAKPAIAQSTAEPVRGRTGRRARAGRVRPHRGQGARRGGAAGPLPPFQGGLAAPFPFSAGVPRFFVTPIRRAFISSLSDNCILGRDAMCIRQRSWGFQTFDALLQRVACFFSCGCREASGDKEASGDNGLSMLRYGRWWGLGANGAWFPTRCVWEMEAGCAQETKMRILLIYLSGGMMRLRRCLWAAVAARFAYFCASAPCRSRYFDIE